MADNDERDDGSDSHDEGTDASDNQETDDSKQSDEQGDGSDASASGAGSDSESDEADKRLRGERDYYKKQYEKLKADKKESPKSAPKPSKQEDNDRLDRIELRQMGVSSEDIQNEARDYAKLKGIPLHKAVESPYVKSLLEAERVKREQGEQQDREEAASAGGASAGTAPSKKISDDPNTWGKDIDLSTPEGVKAYEARLSAKGIDLKKA